MVTILFRTEVDVYFKDKIIGVNWSNFAARDVPVERMKGLTRCLGYMYTYIFSRP